MYDSDFTFCCVSTLPAKPERGSAEAPAAARARTRGDTRQRLVRRGMELLSEQGLEATGIDRILADQRIPKGSFYHYFPSKQAYVESVIDAYAAYFDQRFDRLLDGPDGTPLQRLRAYLDDCFLGMARHDWRRGCLVGNLAQEVCAHNEALRQRLDAVLVSWQSRIAGCLRAAAAAGEIDANSDIDGLAQFFWIGWEGALMRAKLCRNGAPLDCFVGQFFALLPRRPPAMK